MRLNILNHLSAWIQSLFLSFLFIFLFCSSHPVNTCTSLQQFLRNVQGAMSGSPTNQERVILGPLTTTWTAPLSCSVAVQDCQTCSQAWAGQTCFASLAVPSSTKYGVQDNADCWPPRTFSSTPTPPLVGWGFYSPGLDCPYGMTSACSATGGGSSGWQVQFSLLGKETAVGCCPQ